MTLVQQIKIGARVCELKRLAHTTSVAYATLETEFLERINFRTTDTMGTDGATVVSVPPPTIRADARPERGSPRREDRKAR